MENEINDLGLTIYLHYEDERYPTLVIQSETFGSVGYSLNLNDGKLERVCICFAKDSSECVCGYDNDQDEWVWDWD